MSLAARAFLGWYRLWRRALAKVFSVLVARGFDGFGRRTVLEPPIRLNGERFMRIGSRVYVGAGSWLQVLGSPESPALEIADGTNIVGNCVISAATSIRIGRNVLMARNVYIADHMHAFEDNLKPVIQQGITRLAPVEICDGAWLGQNVVVGPGVRIGIGAVIGANAVVLSDVPNHSVATGVPAHVIRSFADDATRGEREARTP